MLWRGSDSTDVQQDGTASHTINEILDIYEEATLTGRLDPVI